MSETALDPRINNPPTDSKAGNVGQPTLDPRNDKPISDTKPGNDPGQPKLDPRDDPSDDSKNTSSAGQPTLDPRSDNPPTNAKGDIDTGSGRDTHTNEQRRTEKQLAERLCGLIEDANARVATFIKMIRQNIENMEAKREEDRDGAELFKRVKPYIEQAEKILHETVGAVRGVDPGNRLSNKARRDVQNHQATPEEQRLAEALKKLMEEVEGTIQWGKNKLNSFPKAKKDVEPLLDSLREPLAQIVGGAALIASGILNLLFRLAHGLHLDGLLKNVADRFGFDKGHTGPALDKSPNWQGSAT